MKYFAKEDVRRFNKYFAIQRGCWIWTGARNRKGYGEFYAGKRRVKAHRYALIGTRQTPLLVCHHCDNPCCVNPAHLFLGTTKQNGEDMKSKLRHEHGERHHNAKLTDADVIRIRRMQPIGNSLIREANRLGVNKTTVYRARKGASWEHVTTALQKVMEGGE
jgi:hypothetical protein